MWHCNYKSLKLQNLPRVGIQPAVLKSSAETRSQAQRPIEPHRTLVFHSHQVKCDFFHCLELGAQQEGLARAAAPSSLSIV